MACSYDLRLWFDLWPTIEAYAYWALAHDPPTAHQLLGHLDHHHIGDVDDPRRKAAREEADVSDPLGQLRVRGAQLTRERIVQLALGTLASTAV